MTLFIEDGAPVIVQGMTGHQGMTHTARMLKAGTNIVGGVNARKAGLDVTFPEAKNGEDATIHVFANCSEAIEATGAKASVVFVPPRFAKDAVVEAIEAGIELIVVITESIPVADSAYFVELALRKGVRIVGPNCPGLLTLPSSKDAKGCNLGIIPDVRAKFPFFHHRYLLFAFCNDVLIHFVGHIRLSCLNKARTVTMAAVCIESKL